MCQITSKHVNDAYALSLIFDDFKSGSLHVDSNVRSNRLFTGETKIIVKRVGTLKAAKLDQVIDKIIAILKDC